MCFLWSLEVTKIESLAVNIDAGAPAVPSLYGPKQSASVCAMRLVEVLPVFIPSYVP
jgi:hypothetical protein